MVVLENDFITMEVEEQNNLFVEKFTSKTSEWTADKWKETRLKLISIFTEQRANKILSFCEDLVFSLTPDLQSWLSDNVSSKIGAFIKKIAIIVPADMLIQLGVEQLMDEQNTGQLTTRYFDNENDARVWLMK